MINVNFFKKEKKNILPLIVMVSFLLMLFAMGLFFYFSRQYYEKTIDDQTDWMTVHAEEVVLSRRLNQLDQHTAKSIVVQEDLRARQYPMNALVENIIAFIPDENNRVQSFQLTQESNQVALIIENTNTMEARNIVEDLNSQPFIEAVQLLRAEEQADGDNQVRFEMIINLNMDGLIVGEEAGE
jgi:hypothetical protein